MKRVCYHGSTLWVEWHDEFHKGCPLCGGKGNPDPIEKMMRKRMPKRIDAHRRK